MKKRDGGVLKADLKNTLAKYWILHLNRKCYKQKNKYVNIRNKTSFEINLILIVKKIEKYPMVLSKQLHQYNCNWNFLHY